MFRWHTQKKGKVAFGHIDGSLSIFQPGNKSQKHVLRPDSLEGTDEEDPVSALEWDRSLLTICSWLICIMGFA